MKCIRLFQVHRHLKNFHYSYMYMSWSMDLDPKGNWDRMKEFEGLIDVWDLFVLQVRIINWKRTPTSSIRKTKICSWAWKTWHPLWPKMIIVKCNRKAHYKISNRWIRVKKSFENQTRSTYFAVDIHFNLSFPFPLLSPFLFLFLLYMREDKKNLMSEFLYLWVCI